jgi:hypothetical protein
MTELRVGDMAPDFTGKILDIVKSDVPVARDIAALLEKARAA